MKTHAGKPGSTICASRVTAPSLSLAALFICLFTLFASSQAHCFIPAHAVEEEHSLDIVVHRDGTYVQRETLRLRILDRNGLHRERVQTFQVNRHYSRFEVISFRVRSADGTVRDVDTSKQLVHTDSASLSLSNIFDPALQEVRIFIPGLQIGDEIIYEVKYTGIRPLMEGQFFGRFMLQGPYPIERLDITVTMPSQKPLYHLIKGLSGQQILHSHKVVSMETGAVVHHWHFENIPPLYPEPDTPPPNHYALRLLVSTLEDWPQVSKWYAALVEPKLQAGPEISQEVRRLTGHLQAQEDRMRVLFFYVARKIRYLGITAEAERPGFEPHDVDITFKRGHGVCRDKAALLVAMLRLAGIPAWPVMVRAGGRLDPEIPVPTFNHAVVAARIEGSRDLVLMDPTDDTTNQLLPDYLQDSSYLVASAQGAQLSTIAVKDPASSRFELLVRQRLSADGTLEGRLTVKTAGFVDTIFRAIMLNRNEEEQRRFLKAFIRADRPNLEIISMEWENLDRDDKPFAFSASFVLKRAVSDAGDQPLLWSFGVQEADGPLERLVLLDRISMTSRHYPLMLDYTFTSSMTEEVILPQGWRCAADPVSGNKVLEVPGIYRFQDSISCRENTLKRFRAMEMEAIEIPVTYYGKLKDLYRVLEANGYRPVPLELK